MSTYKATAINLGNFNLGEADKVITLFTAEKGLVRAVAKGARKPGAKLAGRAEPLVVNKLLIAQGRSLDIVTQAETLETFPLLRKDLRYLSYALYYAELTQHFGAGLSEEAPVYLDYLRQCLRKLDGSPADPAWLCLRFELALLDMLGYRAELTACVICRCPLSESQLAAFHLEWGGVVCKICLRKNPGKDGHEHNNMYAIGQVKEITPLVWKYLILAERAEQAELDLDSPGSGPARLQALSAARRISQGYIEQRAGKQMKSLALLSALVSK